MGKKKGVSQKLLSKVAAVDYPALALAAQREYRAPVAVLFEFGEVEWKKWPDYSAFSFEESDVSELSRLAGDFRIDYAESPLLFSAPIHAMRILARRGNPDFLPALFASLSHRDEYDFFREELRFVLGAMGLPALPEVQKFLALPEESPCDRACMSSGLVEIASRNRAAREPIIAALRGELGRFRENSPEWNGFLIADLIDLAAGEALPLIEAALVEGVVDEMICGDVQQVRAEFGLAPPQRDYGPLFLADKHAKLPHFLCPSSPKK